MFIMPDFIHTPEEWIVWLLGSEFHDTATIDMLVQRTRYSREDTLSFIGVLERMKAVRVNRNAQERHDCRFDCTGPEWKEDVWRPGPALRGQVSIFCL